MSQHTHTSRPGHPVKTAIAARGLRQIDLAAMAGVSPNTLGQVLNGHSASWSSLRQRIAAALDLDESVLFPDDTLIAEARALAATARRAQGLPATITDAAVLARVGRALLGGGDASAA